MSYDDYSERITVTFYRNEGDEQYTRYESKANADTFKGAFDAAFTVLAAAFGHGPEVTLDWIEEWVTEYRKEWFEPSYVVEEE